MSARPDTPTELSAIDTNGVGIQICFFWQGDRYGHRIYALDGMRSRQLLESIEGNANDAWPASPPFSHVNVSWIASDTEQGHVAMLVGAAGNSHWSMCVAARDSRTHSRDIRENIRFSLDGVQISSNRPDETELYFDVACRTSAFPQFLGNSYWSVGNQIAVSSRLNCAFVPPSEPGIVILPHDAELEMEVNQSQSPILRCKATEIRSANSPATFRWRYAIRRSSGGPLRVTSKKR
jgi:hypothetical protein